MKNGKKKERKEVGTVTEEVKRGGGLGRKESMKQRQEGSDLGSQLMQGSKGSQRRRARCSAAQHRITAGFTCCQVVGRTERRFPWGLVAGAREWRRGEERDRDAEEREGREGERRGAVK